MSETDEKPVYQCANGIECEDEIDKFLDLMSTRRRRIVVRLLDEIEQDEVHLKKFCYAVAAIDYDEKFRMVDNRKYNHIRQNLQKNGLKKLSMAGVVEWDRREEYVRHGPNFDVYASRLRAIRRAD